MRNVQNENEWNMLETEKRYDDYGHLIEVI